MVQEHSVHVTDKTLNATANVKSSANQNAMMFCNVQLENFFSVEKVKIKLLKKVISFTVDEIQTLLHSGEMLR